MTFLIGEDKALREKLQGLVVHDQKADGQNVPRQVGVWFGQPDQELRPQNYPYMTIDMINLQRDTQREMRGITNAAYLKPETLPVSGTNQFEVDLPIPFNIDYQITTYARHPRHDREIMAQLLSTRLKRFGYLEIIETDVTLNNVETVTSTFRRMDLLNVAKRDSTEQAKRLFVNALTVRVSSELVESAYRALYQVTNVHVDMPSGGRELRYDGIGSFVITA